MARRSREPDEAFGPMIDGTEDVVTLAKMLLEPETPVPLEESGEPEDAAQEEEQVVLICGDGEIALKLATLATDCGFALEVVSDSATPLSEELVDLARDVHILENYEDFANGAHVDRNHYICICSEDAEECERILMQCLPSDAAYIGACTNAAEAALVKEKLRNVGTPDAELAALCCPMGLAIGARTPEQKAVAIMAEIMAAGSGVLKRLRLVEQR